MSNKSEKLQKYVAFANLLITSINKKTPFSVYQSTKKSGIYVLNNGCKAMRKILVEQEKIIELSKFNVPSWTKQTFLNMSVYNLANVIQDLTEKYDEQYSNNKKNNKVELNNNMRFKVINTNGDIVKTYVGSSYNYSNSGKIFLNKNIMIDKRITQETFVVLSETLSIEIELLNNE